MASSSFNTATPPIFRNENYAIWAVKIEAYLRAFDLLNVVKVGGKPPVVRHANPTIAQLK